MPLIVYDKETGRISQCLLQASIALEKLKKFYDDQGAGTVMVPEAISLFTTYVVNGEVVFRPDVNCMADNKRWIADNEDIMNVSFDPPSKVIIHYQDNVLSTQEDVTELPIQTDLPGLYTFRVEPPWPYRETSFTLVAVEP